MASLRSRRAAPAIDEDENSELYRVEEGNCLDPVCPLCHLGADPNDSDHACRVCGRVFHRACCEESGKYGDFDVSTMDRAFSNIGWSCLDCDDISQSALSAESQMEICQMFNEFDKDDNGSITLDEYLKTRQLAFGPELTSDKIEEETINFRNMDRDESGEIELPEFLAQEVHRYLRKYSKEELVRMLTPLEKKSARRLFNLLDRNKDGVIDMWETLQRPAVASWYQLVQRIPELKRLEEDKKFTRETGKSSDVASGYVIQTSTSRPGLKKKTSGVGQHLLPGAVQNVRACDENQDGVVSWPEFLRGHALDIILSRPNKAEKAVNLLK